MRSLQNLPFLAFQNTTYRMIKVSVLTMIFFLYVSQQLLAQQNNARTLYEKAAGAFEERNYANAEVYLKECNAQVGVNQKVESLY